MATYTQAQVDEAIRKTLTPYSWVTYLPKLTPFTTPSIILNTPTKILIPTTIKSANGFALFDTGGGNFAVQFQGAATATFEISLSTSMTTVTNNVLLGMMMYKNGVMEDGVNISRKIGTGADVGAMAVVGEFTVNPLDIIEIYIEVTSTTTVTFSETSIRITEVN